MDNRVESHKENPVGIEGLAFLQYTSSDPAALRDLFKRLGFTRTGQHKQKKVSLYEQNEVMFLLNEEPGSFSEQFHKAHGPSISAMGWKVTNAQKAFEVAVKNGARPYEGKDESLSSVKLPAVYGIGDSLIYFVQDNFPLRAAYAPTNDDPVQQKGLLKIDHLTNNVPVGEMQKWCDFYAKIFNFKEVRYFDIKGLKTGLISKVMVSPDYKVMIPINEPTDSKSQIQEYLEQYHGSGIQHVAFLSTNAIHTVKELNKDKIAFLSPPPDAYYKMIRARAPLLWENEKELQKLSLLVDGDEAGYLVQIFTKNMIGPIFFEIIQRENHWGFGDGNFQALFDAIERDQVERGYLK